MPTISLLRRIASEKSALSLDSARIGKPWQLFSTIIYRIIALNLNSTVMNMKTKFLKVMPIALCVASLVMVLAQPALAGHRTKKAQNVETLDRVVVVVNDEVITERELQKRIGFYKLEANDSALVPPMNVLRIQALNLLKVCY